MSLPVLGKVPLHLNFYAIAQHLGLRVLIQLKALYVLRRRVQINVVGEVVQIGFHLHLPYIITPADAGIQLI